jgi:FkbM family methyltransferase
MDYGFLVKYKDDLKELYQSLEDEESRDVLEAYLYARYTGDVRSLVRLKRKGALYDWDLLKISPSDILIDAGAYTGDSIMEIKEQYGYIPQHVFALEPDETTIIRLLKNFTPEELIQIHPILAGVHSKDGHVKFCKTGTLASSVSEKGDAEISVQALDSHKAYDGTTVIKMDIEGCEPYALVGAKKLIQQNHPRMAICIYHNNEDLLAVYKFLKKFKYRIFLRQHSSSVEETVMYAI